MSRVLSLLLLLAGCASTSEVAVDFESDDALAGWRAADPGGWRRERLADGSWVLVQMPEQGYRPVHRSPLHIAILDGAYVDGDFELEVNAMQTGREYGHRDLCLLFAVRDPEHFAYAHLATAADDSAHHLQLVDGAPRRPITTWRTQGVDWGRDVWHRLRLERRGARVRVWFDGVEVLASDQAPTWAGWVGLGSFDDEGRFDDLRLHARVSARTAPFFTALGARSP